MKYEELSESAKLADKVWRHMVFGNRFDDEKPSEIRAKYLIPIFGEDVCEEIREYYLTT